MSYSVWGGREKKGGERALQARRRRDGTRSGRAGEIPMRNEAQSEYINQLPASPKTSRNRGEGGREGGGSPFYTLIILLFIHSGLQSSQLNLILYNYYLPNDFIPKK